MKGLLLFLAGCLCGGALVVWLVWDDAMPVVATTPATLPSPAESEGESVTGRAPPDATTPVDPGVGSDPLDAEAPDPARDDGLAGAARAPVPDNLDSGDPSAPLPADASPVPPTAAQAAAADARFARGGEAAETAEARALIPALRIPVDGIAPADLANTYGDARGEGRLHDAIDIMAATGTPVRAVADGRIAKLFTSVPGGLTLYQFDSNDQVAFYYAHLDRYADGIVEGRTVKQGDLIGYVGFTGNANPDAPHLHFAVFVLGEEKNWWEGEAVNPYPLLRRAGTGP